MTPAAPIEAITPNPKLDENILLFVRLLRGIGMRVGPASAVDAVESAQLVGVGNKRYFFHALSSCLVKRPEDRHLFEQAFFLFWQAPKFQERIRDLLIPQIRTHTESDTAEDPMLRRLEEALGKPEAPSSLNEADQIEIDASATVSDRDFVKSMDFRMMSAQEIAAAEQAIKGLRLNLPKRPSRRFRAHHRGRLIDLRRSLKSAPGHFGHVLPQWRRREDQDRPIVVLLDISGSMENYTRMMLHFMHTLTSQHRQVRSFIFGTRLTNITRALQKRDIDEALDAVSNSAMDWSGGTRIADSISTFNREWSRRVLSGSPLVLLVSDGLEKQHDDRLAFEMERLHKSCHRLIWLNPLLRFGEFSPKSLSIQRILAHVDSFLPIHSLNAMEALVEGLGKIAHSRDPGIAAWQRQARLLAAETPSTGDTPDGTRQ
ncbi:MAG: vWA domain-containing protein [Candidatus Puniceispirillales bacterium]